MALLGLATAIWRRLMRALFAMEKGGGRRRRTHLDYVKKLSVVTGTGYFDHSN